MAQLWIPVTHVGDQIKLLAPGFDLAQPQLVLAFGEQKGNGRILPCSPY